MTEAAIAAGAPAPVEPSLAPVDIEPVRIPEPLSSQTPVADKLAPAAKEPLKSVADTIRAASEKVKAEVDPAKAAEPAKTEPKPQGKAEPPRQEQKPAEAKPRDEATGRFANRESQPQQQVPEQKPADPHAARFPAPARFHDGAKAEWDAAPLSVRAEVNRALREADEGIAKHKQAADKYDRIRTFYEAAENAGLDPQRVIHNYIEIDRSLKQDFLGGLDQICQRAGVTLRQVAERVLGVTPDQAAAKQDQTVQSLRAELSSVKASVQQQVFQTVRQEVTQFAQDHPRLDELAPQIGRLIETGMAATLPEAYEMAERLSPAPQLFTQADQTRDLPAAQTSMPEPAKPAGQKSISGAPASGEAPASRRSGPPPSIRESLRLAAGRAR